MDLDRNEFKIPEVIFDLTLVLSPHVCLLSMLFHIKGFEKISTTRPVLEHSARKPCAYRRLGAKERIRKNIEGG